MSDTTADAAAPVPHPRRRRVLPKLALVLLVSLAGTEVGLRVVLRLKGEPYGAWRTQQRLRDIVRGMRDRVPMPDDARLAEEDSNRREVLHPYFGFDPVGCFEQTYNDLRVFLTGRGEQTYDILLLGGSVAAGFGHLGRQRLFELLRADPRFAHRPLRLLHQARGAYKQPQQAMVLVYLLNLGFEPDAVLCIDGFNEVALANQNAAWKTHPVYPASPQWSPLVRGGLSDPSAIDIFIRMRERRLDAERLVRNADRFHLTWSAALGRLCQQRMRSIREDWGEQLVRYKRMLEEEDAGVSLRGIEFDDDLDSVLTTAVRAWAESLEVIQAVCDRRGIPFLDVLQPTLHDPGAKPATEEELRSGTASDAWMDAVVNGYPRLRSMGERLATRGVSFCDASRVFVDVEETLYFDACHFSARGNEILAEHVARAFLDALPPE